MNWWHRIGIVFIVIPIIESSGVQWAAFIFVVVGFTLIEIGEEFGKRPSPLERLE